MAAKLIKTSKKKSGSKKKKSGKALTILVIFLILALLFFFGFKLIKPSKNSATEVIQTSQVVDNKPTTEKPAVEKPEAKTENNIDTKVVKEKIAGPWMSTSEGAYLDFENDEYSIDFSGIDSDKPIAGKFYVDSDIITITSDNGLCKDIDGVYEVKFDEDCIVLKCKNDDCLKRKGTLETKWRKIRVED